MLVSDEISSFSKSKEKSAAAGSGSHFLFLCLGVIAESLLTCKLGSDLFRLFSVEENGVKACSSAFFSAMLAA
jgi:hypothetical protein